MIGQTISHYKILEKLGEGGMGVVYKAHDTKLNREVAIKFLPPHLSIGGVERERFLKEAQTAAALNHPNICVIHEINEDSVQPYIVMEFVDGSTIRTKLENGPFKIDDAIKYGIQIGEALHEAHSKGITHRDIKPENIIITDNGIVKIADFGLASLTNDMNARESRTVAGTTCYMSPEQVRGEYVDHLTDIWSLGVILYEMVTGRRPFAGEYEQAITYLIVQERHKPPSGIRRDIPSALEKIIDRCLEKVPALRVPDAAALAYELRQIEHVLKNPQKTTLKSIAVLPFSNISPDKDNEYFSEGLTEEIIANLSKLRMVRVVSRTSVMQYNREEKTMKQIAFDLAVQYILDGSVRIHGSDLRITTQLVDASQDTFLWSEKYRGSMEDIFDIQETVAAKIVKALKVRMSPHEKNTLKRRFTENTEAYQLYLKGRFFWNKRNRTGMETAIRYFEQAIQKDSQYALAWAGLADSYILISDYGHATRKETYPKAKAAVEKALAIDDKLAEAHTSLALLMMLGEMDWTNAGKEFERAIQLKPNYATAHHWFAEWLMYTGRVEDAIHETMEAALLDPLSPAILKDKGLTLYYARQYDAAIVEAKKTLEIDPHFASAHRLLSLVYQGMFSEAIMEHQEWERTGANRTEVALALAQLLAASGKRAEALNVLGNLTTEQLHEGSHFRGMALAYTALGENDIAFQWFEQACEARAVSLCSIKIDPKLDQIRSDPRFNTLLKKVGLEQ
jgi:serine/threonine protein kinase/Tfp pilus assembly protein PilF